ncbi:hypothetical protein N7478_007681 [Penicillium angulare]|uniref:uncharacterized protein n=1 Tax=Penicillium angulare TaxID=116970 RepID=UPI002540814A|nr:uncharacterized protein N7478_007681 [Penicillium angulare]KAJ5272556.1 hypothetical protein N7478_007681 [Penicillium angulare]
MTSLNGHATPSEQAARRRADHHEADVVIIGAGILGCALAVTLGRQGRSVILLEASMKEPDRIVGELLQPGGVQALEKLGMSECLEDIDAISVKGYYISYHGEPVELDYPRETASSPEPRGRAFHHGRFVMKLRQAALACPNVTVVETKATGLVTSTHTKQVLGVECVTKDMKDCYFAQLTVAADGYNSVFRKGNLPHTPTRRSKFWGLEMIDAPLPSPCCGHVLLGDIAPILMYQIGTHETRILIDIPENLPAASIKNGGVKGYMRNCVLPVLPKDVQQPFLNALETGSLRSMPNSFLPASTNKTAGLMILGDALNMRHPLTGGGMTVALNDVCVIRELLSPEAVPSFEDTELVLKQLSRFHWMRKKSSTVINILAQALYMLFAADDKNLRALQQGCFRYFQIANVDQPVLMLAGLLKQPLVLVTHFFTVAFLAIWVQFRQTPFTHLILFPFQSVMVFWTACIVIVPYILAELWS